MGAVVFVTVIVMILSWTVVPAWMAYDQGQLDATDLQYMAGLVVALLIVCAFIGLITAIAQGTNQTAKKD